MNMNIRFGLCCVFLHEPIKFRSTTVTHILKLDRQEALKKISALCLENTKSLMEALIFCKKNNIGCFRINSRILPIKTHPQAGYKIEELPDYKEIISAFVKAGQYAKDNDVRTTFHPDQFVLLNSIYPDVNEASIKEIEYQSEVAEWVGADVVNIHGGSAVNGKEEALKLFAHNFSKLSYRARKLLTVENDDVSYTPSDLLPLCDNIGIPLVYDVHHHRCNPDEFSCSEATDLAIKTWNREPLFHISSPISGYDHLDERSHHDYINASDFPRFWLEQKITVEVEAKAKEVAIAKLISELTNKD